MFDRVYGRLAPAFGIIAGLCVIVAVLLLCVNIVCLDKGFYAEQQKTLDIGMTEQGIADATGAMIDYITGTRDNLDVTAEIYGQQTEVFNQREKDHMVDVRSLYTGAMSAAWCMAGVGVGIFAVLCITKKRKYAFLGYTRASHVFLAVAVVLALWAVIDFYSFWTAFHGVFFTNDLWLLDPATDVMIRLFPGELFFNLLARLALVGALALGALYALALILKRRFN